MGKVSPQFMTALSPSYAAGNRDLKSSLIATSLPPGDAERGPVERTSLAYFFLACFVLIYWARPSYWVPGAGGIPFAKITGALAVGGFFLWFILERRRGLSLPREMIYLLLLFFQLCLAIPFSIWPGGSFELVVLEYSKIVLVTVVAMMTITSLTRLRRLVFIQTATVTLMAAVAISGHGTMVDSLYGQRLAGIFGGTYGNPNDFALDLALIFPLAFALLLSTRNVAWKALWFVSMGLVIYTVLATYSRGGLLALLVGAGVATWEFAVKGRRLRWILLLVMSGLVIVILSGPAGYGRRLATIFNPNDDVTGSAQDRTVLAERAWSVTVHSPLWGVGPGNFQVVSGTSDAHDWHDAHNTYLQLSAEAGIPALILFLLMFKAAFSSLRSGLRLTKDANAIVLAGGLRASLFAFAVGAFFGNTAYHFFPYFLVAYSSAFRQIAGRIEAPPPEPSAIAEEAHTYA